ncbi:MAG: hypothetical protein JWQ04_705, partial [Pedosphaera sp.]|nr:hypothetical protein [Pedosphaera sp.]
MGSKGYQPVPVGYQPTGTSEALVGQLDAG